VNRLLQLFIDICLLRGRPQDLPASGFLFGLTLAATLATAIPILLISLNGLMPTLAAAAMDVALMLIFLRGGLYFLKLESRFLQTASAMFGTGAIINLVSIPIHMMLIADSGSDLMPLLGSLLYLMLLVWSLVVLGHILRHSLEIPLGGGVAIAVVYFVLILLLVQQLPGAT
jgi:hypothetical protein